MLALQIKRCAELVQIAETERARHVRGEPVDLRGLSQFEGSASRAMRLLGLITEDPHRRQRVAVTDTPSELTLEQYRAEIEAEARRRLQEPTPPHPLYLVAPGPKNAPALVASPGNGIPAGGPRSVAGPGRLHDAAGPDHPASSST